MDTHVRHTPWEMTQNGSTADLRKEEPTSQLVLEYAPHASGNLVRTCEIAGVSSTSQSRRKKEHISQTRLEQSSAFCFEVATLHFWFTSDRLRRIKKQTAFDTALKPFHRTPVVLSSPLEFSPRDRTGVRCLAHRISLSQRKDTQLSIIDRQLARAQDRAVVDPTCRST